MKRTDTPGDTDGKEEGRRTPFPPDLSGPPGRPWSPLCSVIGRGESYRTSGLVVDPG